MDREKFTLSPSIAAILLARSPLHAWRAHRDGGNVRDEATDAMRRGKLLDRLLFRTGPEIVIVEADAWRTNAAKEAREAAENRGAIAVLRGKHDEAERQANELRAGLFDAGVNLNDGASQARLTWESDGVPCKGFADLVFAGGDSARIYDLKIVDDASPGAIKADLRGSLQSAAYVEALETNTPALAGRVSFAFIFAEPDTGCITIAEPDGQSRALAASRWRRAVKLWDECRASGRWPGYSREVVRMSPKPWDLDEEMNAMVPTGGSKEVPF